MKFESGHERLSGMPISPSASDVSWQTSVLEGRADLPDGSSELPLLTHSGLFRANENGGLEGPPLQLAT